MLTKELQIKNEIEQDILKEISSGRYKDTYLIYNRKSTDEPENQKNSIKYQKSENVRFSYKEHLQIAAVTLPGFCMDGIISERHSGFKEDTALVFGEDGTVQYKIDRPKFYRLVQFLSNGYFKGVIVLCWDRASRNRGDDTVIRKLMKQGLDFRFPLASYDKTSSGALHMDIDGMFAEHHSRVTSEKVSLNIKMKQDQGYCTQKAPVGYLNLGNMEDKPIDPERGPIIEKLFENYATGEWSLADCVRWSIQQGFTMPPSRRHRTKDELLDEEFLEEDGGEIKNKIKQICRIPTISAIHKILTRRFYTGEIRNSKGEYITSKSHKAIVSKELFDKVQVSLNKKSVSIHYIKKIDYPFRGMVRCAICKRVYTPYTRKGILYYGSRCAQACPNKRKNINLKGLTTEIDFILKGLYFNQEELDELEAIESTDIAVFEVKRHKQLEENERKKRTVREDLAYLNSNKLTLLKSGAYTAESIVLEEKRLNEQLYSLQEEEHISDVSMEETVKEMKKLSELVKTVYSYYQGGETLEKQEIVKKIFSELTLDENSLQYKCKIEFQSLESRFLLNCGRFTRISELSYALPLIKQGIYELNLIFKN